MARGANLVLGIWLFISAFIWPHGPEQLTNTWILGVVFAVVALVAMSSDQVRWINTVASIWLFISVWALRHENAGTMWNNALVALVVFFLSLVPSGSPGRLVPQRVPT